MEHCKRKTNDRPIETTLNLISSHYTKWAAVCVCDVSGSAVSDAAAATIFREYLVDLDQTSQKYSLGHGAVQA